MAFNIAFEQKITGLVLKDWFRAAVFLVLSACILWPIWSVENLPLVDFPNHLAKIHIAVNLNNSENLQQYYQYDLPLVPNLAMDLILPPIANAIGVEPALKLFLSWSLIQLVIGTIFLRKVLFKKSGYIAFLAFTVAYNHIVEWAFLNFLFTAGFALNLFALWIYLQPKPTIIRVLIFAPLMALIFFFHMFATGILCFWIGVYEVNLIYQKYKEVGNFRDSQQTIIRELSASIPPAIIVITLWLLSTTGKGEDFAIWGGLISEIRAFFSPFFLEGTIFDILLALSIYLFICIALCKNYITITRQMRMLVIFTALLAIAIPMVFLGIFGTDFRLPTLLICLVIASIQIRQWNHINNFFIAIIIVFTSIRIIETQESWEKQSQSIASLRANLAHIPEGKRLLTASNDRSDKAWLHIPAYYTIDRNGFDPLLFSATFRQPVHVKPKHQSYDTLFGLPVLSDHLFWENHEFHTPNRGNSNYYWNNWQKNFDYLLFLHRKEPYSLNNVSYLKPITMTKEFTIYEINFSGKHEGKK